MKEIEPFLPEQSLVFHKQYSQWDIEASSIKPK